MNFAQLFWLSTYTFPQGHYEPMHSHAEAEIIIYTKGKGITNINNSKYEFHAGSVAVVNPRTLHDEMCNEETSNILIRFTMENFNIPNGVYNLSNTVILEQLMKQIRNEMTAPRYAYKELISLKIKELSILIMREIISHKYDGNLSQCHAFIEENYTQNLDIKEVAADFGFTYENFRHKFKKNYGLSPRNFIILKRLQKSHELLELTDKSCTEIAAECGFSDSLQFSKMFKKQYGYSPNSFRKNIIPFIEQRKVELYNKNSHKN